MPTFTTRPIIMARRGVVASGTLPCIHRRAEDADERRQRD